MYALDAGQATRAKSSHVKAVTMVKLDLFTDKRHGIINQTYYLAEVGLKYDYGNTGTLRDFLPYLDSVSNLVASMRHLPDVDQADGWDRRIDVRLRNDFYPGGLATSNAGRFIEELRGPSRTRRLIGAAVEVSELLIDTWSEPAAPLDLSAFTGAEHTIRFRGVVERLGPVSIDSIGLACVTETPQATNWPSALDPIGTPPDFLGRRLPWVYGRTFVACVPIDVGATSSLAGALATTGGVELTDASRFPSSGTTTIQIGKEQITYTGKSGNTLTGVTRAANSTVAVAHAAGEAVIEVQTANKWALAGHPLDASAGMNALFVRNPFNSEIVRVRGALLPTVTPYDRSSVAGHDCATFAFTNTQLKALLDELSASSRVTQQPVVSHPTSATLLDDHPTSGDSNLRDSNFGTSVLYTTTAPAHLSDTVTFSAPSGTITRQVIKVNGWSVSQDIDISCGGSIGVIPAGNSQSTYEFVTTNTSNSVTVSIASSPAASGRVYEISRDVTYTEAAPTIATNTAIEAANLGYDLEFFADLNGLLVPKPPTVNPCWSFDSGSYSATNCAASLDTQIKVDGASSLKIEINETHATLRESCESTTGWTGAATLATDSAWKTQGTNSITGTAPSTSATNMISPTFGPVDLTGSARLIVAVDVLADLAVGDSIDFVLHSTGRGSAYRFPASSFPAGEPITVYLDYTRATDYTTGAGALTETAFNQVEVTFNNASGASGKSVKLDNIRTLPLNCYAQVTGLASQDFNANNAEYQFSLRGRQADRRRRVLIQFAGTGGLVANSYSLDVVATEALRERDWRKWRGVLRASAGSPAALNAITEIRVTTDYTAAGGVHGPYPWDGGIQLTTWIDGIYGRDDTQNAYAVAVNGLMQRPDDVMRHWTIEAGAQSFDAGSTATDLANVRLAVDMRQLTDGDWARGLAALGYSSRANVVPIETASARKWKPLAAETGFDFAVPTVSILDRDEIDDYAETDRGLGDLATRFVAMIDFDVRAGSDGEDAYSELVRCSPQRSDCAIPTAAALEAVEVQYGAIESQLLAFPALPGSRISVAEHLAGSREVIGYYASERSRIANARTFAFRGLPWYELGGSAWAVELGDTFSFQPPWDTAAVSCRVIEVARSFDTRQVDLVAVEVPT